MLSFLVFLIVLGLCAPAAYAADVPALTLSSGEARSGGPVTLTVSVKDNPGFAVTMLYLYYDTSVFTTDPSKEVHALGTFQRTGGILANTIASAKANGRYHGEADQDGILVLWYNTTGTDTSGDGEFLSITLHAREGAANGSYTVRAVSSAEDTYDQDDNAIDFGSSSAVVTVSDGMDSTGGASGGQSGSSPEVLPDQPDDSSNKPEPAAPAKTAFKDTDGHWAEALIAQAAQMELIYGYEGLYRPDDNMTRAELVTVLWRAVGSPAPSGKAAFTDLTQDWYYDSVAWAAENNVVNGVGDGKFDPDNNVTREQLAAILHRMEGSPTGLESMLTGIYDAQYSDSGQIDSWAKHAVYWTVYKGIYCGEDSLSAEDELAPMAAANRAQIAVMVVRYLEKQK